jgi:hypothetical protein
MSELTQKEQRDLVRVPANIWKGADRNVSTVESWLSPDFRQPLPDAPRELVFVCGHSLLLAGDRPYSKWAVAVSSFRASKQVRRTSSTR